MQAKFPFTSYDFYAYLTSGAFLVAGLHIALDLNHFSNYKDFGFIQIAGLVATSYTVGHIVGQISSIILEALITHNVFGNPFEHLIVNGKEKPSSLFVAKWLNIGELKPITGLTKISDTDSGARKASAFKAALDSEGSRERLSAFLNLYGYARNTSLVCFLVGLVGLINCGDLTTSRAILFAGIFSIGILMYFRYLKFYAAHAREIVKRMPAAAS